eukprot:COSAG01_NODE_325_length_18790_cov_64.371101_6_plen_48_part_00
MVEMSRGGEGRGARARPQRAAEICHSPRHTCTHTRWMAVLLPGVWLD